jgi:DNA polymerase
MGQLRQAAGTCQACALHAGREKPVFADGEPEAGAILFLGSAPSAEDNPTGIPYSGPAGQLLTDIIEKGMGLDRGRVSITHLVKCPTPGGRAPSDTEIGLCAPWLQRQLELASPSVLIPLGQVPANFLVGSKADLEELRDQVFERLGRRVVPTYEPAQLLLEPEKKRACWSDIQRAMAAAGLKKRP